VNLTSIFHSLQSVKRAKTVEMVDQANLAFKDELVLQVVMVLMDVMGLKVEKVRHKNDQKCLLTLRVHNFVRYFKKIKLCPIISDLLFLYFSGPKFQIYTWDIFVVQSEKKQKK
jgi:hypothetical protein